MTKFNDDFVREVKNFFNKGRKKKKPGYKRDGSFSINDIVEKFNLTEAQVKRILYVRKLPEEQFIKGEYND
jgi:hypothetical protein|tara:strand:+ start:2188 stop:2400 length:213 start_codon:yes stop_codon:yes gene_type:complete